MLKQFVRLCKAQLGSSLALPASSEQPAPPQLSVSLLRHQTDGTQESATGDRRGNLQGTAGVDLQPEEGGFRKRVTAQPGFAESGPENCVRVDLFCKVMQSAVRKDD